MRLLIYYYRFNRLLIFIKVKQKIKENYKNYQKTIAPKINHKLNNFLLFFFYKVKHKNIVNLMLNKFNGYKVVKINILLQYYRITILILFNGIFRLKYSAFQSL